MRDLPNLAKFDYGTRINRAIDYITRNLDQPLRLEEVARAACFSPFHFHRIFHALMQETLASFVKRVRLERALYLLSHRRRVKLTDVALACGFTSSSDFSRCFRAHYGVAPRKFDVKSFRHSRREEMRASLASPGEPNRFARLPRGVNPDGFVATLRKLQARRVAYIRVHQPYEGDRVPRAVARLLAWAEARGLADGQWLGYQWEDPEVVPLEKCRYDVGLVVSGLGNKQHLAPDMPEVAALNRVDATPEPDNGEVSFTVFPPFLVAEIDIAGSVDLELRALDWLFRTWLPGSGYAPAHQPMFEAFNGRPFADGMDYFKLRVQLPIADARVPL